MEVATSVKIDDYVTIVDPDEAAWAYLNAFSDIDELRESVFPYVRNEFRIIHRRRTLAQEKKTFDKPSKNLDQVRLPVALLTNRLLLVTETFALSDGTRVKWLEATPAQHRERAAMQRRLAGSCILDAERHEQAADLIEQFGVSCLAEIPDDAI